MKQGHLLVLLLMIYTICFMALYAEQIKYESVQKEKQRMEDVLLESAFFAARSYEKVIYATEETKKNTVRDTFLESLEVFLEKISSEEETEYPELYIPLLILAEEDGAYFCYIQEENTDNGLELKHVWSEKIPYPNSDGNSIPDMIESFATDIVSRHNYIASQFGITYQFYAPEFLWNDSEKLNLPMLYIVFQGWPLNSSKDTYYENCIDAGIYVREEEYYTILGPESLAEAFCVYHEPSCTMIEGHYVLEEAVTKEEALLHYGARPCKECLQE